jgi:DNA polymerase-3 subunit gamma/tau
VREPLPTPTPTPKPATDNAAAVTSAAPASASSNNWRDIIESLAISGMVKQLAANCVLKNIGEHSVELILDSGYKQLLHSKAEKRLQQALAEYLDRDIRLDVSIGDAAAAAVETPARSVAREQDEKQQQAEQSIEQDSFVQAMKENFNAEVVPGSVKPVAENTE